MFNLATLILDLEVQILLPRVDGSEYKIAIELKSNSNIHDAVKMGLKRLQM